jgi:hypothetical protein
MSPTTLVYGAIFLAGSAFAILWVGGFVINWMADNEATDSSL